MVSIPLAANQQQLDIRVAEEVLWRFVANNENYELFFRYEYEWEQPYYRLDWGLVIPLELVQLTVGHVMTNGTLKLTDHLLGYGRNSGYAHNEGTIELADGLTMTDTHGVFARFYPFDIPMTIVVGGTIDDRVQQAVFGGALTIQDEFTIDSWHTVTLFNHENDDDVTNQSWFTSEYDTNPHRFNNSSIHLLLDQPGLDVALHGVVQYGAWLIPQGSTALHITAGAKPHYGSIKGGWASPLLIDADGSLSQRLWQIDSGYDFIPSKHFELAASYEAIGYSNTENLQTISYTDIQWVHEYQLSMDIGLVITKGDTEDDQSNSNERQYELWVRPSSTANYKTDTRIGNQYKTRLTADAKLELEFNNALISASFGASYRWQWYDDSDLHKQLTCEFAIDGTSIALTGSVRWEAEALATLLPTMATAKLAYAQSPIEWFVALELTQFPPTADWFTEDAIIKAGFAIGW